MVLAEDKKKEGTTLIKAAFAKRIQAQKLLDEADDDIARGRMLILEAEEDEQKATGIYS